MDELLGHDTELIFADWGQSACLEEVQSYFDPETGQVEESISETPLTVLVGKLVYNRFHRTDAIATVGTQTFVAKKDDLPIDLSLEQTQLIFDDKRFVVVSWTDALSSSLVMLECTSR